MTRAALYARYSSAFQTPTSIEDQLRICNQIAARDGHAVIQSYTDYEISGTHMLRSGLQNLLADAQDGKFDVVIAEALDRLSRDQEGTAHLYKRLTFLGIKIVTLSEGVVNKLHVALKGTMNEMYIDELSLKTHRGLEGRVLQGKSGGGISYGYSMMRDVDAGGDRMRGERAINEDEAAIVRRIFEAYKDGASPRAIAHSLNAEGVAGPRGGEWSASTINGNRKRGTGVLNNELYVGVLVWDRQKFGKDPVTGKRVARPNANETIKRVDVPELRIVAQTLWDDVKALQARLDHKPSLEAKRRPPKLFSHLLKCGCCGGGMSIVSQGRYGCSTARNKGTCDNRITVSESEIETRVLHALQARLMDKELCAAFCERYTAHLNRVRHEHNAARADYAAELDRVNRRIKKLVQSIMDGVPGAMVKDEAIELDRRKTELTQILETTEDAPIFVHPNMAHRYSVQIQNLIASMEEPDQRDKSAQVIRKLIDKIVFTPNDDKSALVIDLIGDLAGILLMTEKAGSENLYNNLATLSPAQKAEIEQIKLAKTEGNPGLSSLGKVKMVAGVGFEPTTFRL
ncbi:recombinase family protein [Novosphingobium aquimarinum]|uniref:recombinase family protein n=1 Tax=Novosphingobium aquimarinum TaxID=2682494 RepID=UPI0012EC5FB1|nr:recombinase family protein [Novosphingobium aquimarinum]